MTAEYLDSEKVAIQKMVISLSKDGTTYTTIDDKSILTVCFSMSIFSPVVTFSVTFNDYKNYFSIIDTSKAFWMKAEFIDKFATAAGIKESSFTRICRVTNCQRVDGTRTSLWVITGQDEISYDLANTYLKRNQITNATGMFTIMISALNLDQKITQAQCEIEANSPKDDEAFGSIRITSDKNLLNQLVKMGAERNVHFFQTLHKIHFGELSVKDLKANPLKDLAGQTFVFQNACSAKNSQYVGKIHEYVPELGDQTISMQNPVTSSQVQVGTDSYDSSNSANTVLEDILLNDNLNSIQSQDTTGKRSDPNSFNVPGLQKYNTIRNFLRMNKLTIHVPGCFYADDIYKVCKVKITPMTDVSAQTIKGQQSCNGYWLIGGADYLVDKCAFRTRLTLYRYDNPEK